MLTLPRLHTVGVHFEHDPAALTATLAYCGKPMARCYPRSSVWRRSYTARSAATTAARARSDEQHASASNCRFQFSVALVPRLSHWLNLNTVPHSLSQPEARLPPEKVVPYRAPDRSMRLALLEATTGIDGELLFWNENVTLSL